MNYQEIREQICDVCHKMWQLGWVAANDGNVSVKLPDGNFLVTPTGISKSFIAPEKLVIIDKDMNIVEAEGNYKPSSEIKMHMRCYIVKPVFREKGKTLCELLLHLIKRDVEHN